MGDFTNRAPAASAQKVCQDMIAYGVAAGFISSTYSLTGHRGASGASTSCPGDNLNNIIKGWPRYVTSISG